MKYKALLIALILLLLVSNGFWIYSTFNTGVTQTYHQQMTYEFANQIIALSNLGNYLLRNMPKDSALKIMKDVFEKEEIFEKDNGIHGPWISLGMNEKGNVKEIIVEENVKGWAENGKTR